MDEPDSTETGSTSNNIEVQAASKAWHGKVHVSLRLHLVQKLLRHLISNITEQELQNPLIKDLMKSVEETETRFYHLSNRKEEYYHMLAEHIHHIKKMLDRKTDPRCQEYQVRMGG